MVLAGTKTLTLNSDYTPFSICGWKTAFTKLFSDNVYCVQTYDKQIMDSMGRFHNLPAVIVLKEYINMSGKKSPYSKKNVFLRDENTCQYCGYKFDVKYLQIDHVIPRSKPHLLKGKGLNSYENTVTACFYCNQAKADKTLDQCGMSLLRQPKPISRSQKIILDIKSRQIPKEWEVYVESYI